MSLWTRLFPLPKPARFSRLVSRALRASGVTNRIQYDPEHFKLLIEETPKPRVLFLGNMYRDYCDAPFRRRREILQGYIRPLLTPTPGIPDNFDQVRPNLLPRIQDRAFWEVNKLQFQLQGLEFQEVARRPLTDHVELQLVYDCPEYVVSIDSEKLEGWKISFDEALAIGRENLWKKSNADFLKIQPGLYVSPWRDTHDASRLFLHDLVWQLAVKGDHVAMVPQRNVLLVTGSQDETGLLKMAEIARQELQGNRPMTGIPVRLDGNTWKTYIAQPGDLAYHQLHHLWIENALRDYGQQKELLDKLHQKQGKDIFVANVMAMRKDETGEERTFCLWSEGVDSLLPQTEWVAFASDSLPKESVVRSPKWDQVMAIVGGLMEPAGLYPERYRVRQFPSREQLRALGVLEA